MLLQEALEAPTGLEFSVLFADPSRTAFETISHSGLEPGYRFAYVKSPGVLVHELRERAFDLVVIDEDFDYGCARSWLRCLSVLGVGTPMVALSSGKLVGESLRANWDGRTVPVIGKPFTSEQLVEIVDILATRSPGRCAAWVCAAGAR